MKFLYIQFLKYLYMLLNYIILPTKEIIESIFIILFNAHIFKISKITKFLKRNNIVTFKYDKKNLFMKFVCKF